jgi:hypothetical protein
MLALFELLHRLGGLLVSQPVAVNSQGNCQMTLLKLDLVSSIRSGVEQQEDNGDAR